jgi:hypothetical protein
MKPSGVSFSRILRVPAPWPGGSRIALELVQNGTFTGAIRGLGREENMSLPWYNLNSRQTNLSIRHFNNLKSIRERSPELGWGWFSESVFAR